MRVRERTFCSTLRTCVCMAVAISLSAVHSPAQNLLPPSVTLNSDKSVTFSFREDEAAEVSVDGTFRQPIYRLRTAVTTISKRKKAEMTLSDGVWTYTSGPLASDMYVYNFVVDGMKAMDPESGYVVRDIDNMLNYFITGGGDGDYYMERDVPHGKVTDVWYPSTMRRWERRRMNIYTPPSFSSSGETRYPVLYLLHGSGGDEDSWVEMGRIAQILDNLIAEGAVRPMIVVMPNGNVELDAAPGKGTLEDVRPTASNPKSMMGEVEKVFVSDIVGYVDSNYPTVADKAHRGIAGLSLGGLHTLFVCLNNPEEFDYIGLFSAQVSNMMHNPGTKGLGWVRNGLDKAVSAIPFLPRKSGAEDGSGQGYDTDDLYIYNNVDEKLDTLFSANPRLFYIAHGKDDVVRKINDDLREKLDNKGYPYVFNETDGGHTWSNWRRYALDFLPRLFK